MLGSNVLDVAIGMMFIYLVLSLVSTVVNEWIASAFQMRGKNLLKGIKNLLNDPGFTGLAQQLYCHGLVDCISKGVEVTQPGDRKAGTLERLPSYMPSQTFALALLDILSSDGAVSKAREVISDQERKGSAADEKLLEKARQAASVQGLAEATGNLAVAHIAASRKPKDEGLQQEVNTAREAVNNAHASLESAQKASAAETAGATPQVVPAPQVNPAAPQQAVGAPPQDPAGRLPNPDAQPQNTTSSAALQPLKKKYTIAGQFSQMEDVSYTLEKLLEAGRALAETDPLGHLEEGVKRLPGGHTRESLMLLISRTRRGIGEITGDAQRIKREGDELQKNLEHWFDDAMERIGGWYKRWSQWVLVGIACFLVGLLNVDSVVLAKRLMRDTALRSALVAASDNAVKNKSLTQSLHADQGADGGQQAPASPKPPEAGSPKPPGGGAGGQAPGAVPGSGGGNAPNKGAGSAGTGGPGSPGTSNSNQAKVNPTDVTELLDQVQAMNLPLGWTPPPNDPLGEEQVPPRPRPGAPLNEWEVFLGRWWLKLLGWVLTIAAVSLGAPFWFDTLSKFVNIRGAGTPPGEKKRSAGAGEKAGGSG
jgi:hypothetical protein